MAIDPGLREKKKQRTRQQIFESASRLFTERGFDAITVAEVAREAEVSEVTVFNYFRTKEDLFFGGMEFFEESLLEAVRERSAGESALDAFRRRILESSARLADEANDAVIARSAAVIKGSPALRAREQEVAARYTRALAELLAAEAEAPPDDVEAASAAAALMGAHRALVEHVRGRVLAGLRGRRLVNDFRRQAARAFALLEQGLEDYAVR